MQAELTGICHWCGKEIGTTAGVRLEFNIPVDGEPNWSVIEKRWVHSIMGDCDGVKRKTLPGASRPLVRHRGRRGLPPVYGNLERVRSEMSLDYMVKLRLQLGNQGFDTDDLSDDEVSERFELKRVRECGFCRSTSNLVGDPDAPAVCRGVPKDGLRGVRAGRQQAVSPPAEE